jgi:hypothetical protein
MIEDIEVRSVGRINRSKTNDAFASTTSCQSIEHKSSLFIEKMQK